MNTEKNLAISKEKFEAYYRVQQSGVTNMMDVNRVSALTNRLLTVEDILDIINNYDTYHKKYIK